MAIRYGQLINHLFYHRKAFKTVRKFRDFSSIPFSTDQEKGVVQENVKSQQHQISPQPGPSMPRRSSNFLMDADKIYKISNKDSIYKCYIS